MITRWHLSNFKAFSKHIDLGLAPLTLFMGANSSGKSTILQSILLIKQTLQYAAPDKPLALNGPLVRLGDFEDVATDFTSLSRFVLGWTIDFRKRGGLSQNDFGLLSDEIARASFRAVHKVSANLTFGPAKTSKKAQSSVEVSLVEAAISAKYDEVGESDDQEFIVEIDQARTTDFQSATLSPSHPARRLSDANLFRVKSIGPEAKNELLGHLPKGANIVGVQLRNFFPAQYVVRFD